MDQTSSPQTQPDSLKEKIVTSIQSGQVTMRPKWQFVLKAGLVIAGGILMLLVLIYLVSFAIFITQPSRGFGDFISSLPLLVLAVALICVVLLEILVRKYDFAHRRPILYSLGAIVLLVFFMGILLARTGFHNELYERAHTGRLEVGGEIYRYYDLDQDADDVR